MRRIRGTPLRWLAGSAAVVLLAVSVLAAAGRLAQSRGERRDAAIAVLPFANLSADADQEYFSDGLTEDVLTALSQIGGLRVISRTSAMRYKHMERTVPEIGRELGVTHVLEGSVRREGNRVRVTAQLIDARSDAHIWAETYERELTGLFNLQSELAQRIAGALSLRLTSQQRVRIASAAPANPAAYDLLLRGREYLNRPGDADELKYAAAVSFFRQALELEPGYPRALVGLSEAFRRNVTLREDVRVDSSVAYARRAVAASPELAEASAALGAALALAGDHAGAGAAFRHALSLDPNQGEALAGMARLAALEGRLDGAAAWQARAVAVDPTSPVRRTELGSLLFDLGDLDGAAGAFSRALDFAPDDAAAAWLLAQTHLVRGEFDRADARMRDMVAASSQPSTRLLMARYEASRGRLDSAESYLEGAPNLGLTLMVRALIAQQRGDTAAVRGMLGPAARRWIEVDPGGDRAPRGLFHVLAALGERQAALDVLRRHWHTGMRGPGSDPPEIGVYWIDRVDAVAPLRDDPGFLELLTRMRGALDSMRALPRR